MGENGKWFSESRIIWALFAILIAIGGWWTSGLQAEIKSHAGQIRSIELVVTKQESLYSEIIRRLDRIERKLEK